MAFSRTECRVCAAGQRLSTLAFAIFAAALTLAAMDPEETALRQAVLALCAGLSGLAVFRFPVARLVRRVTPGRASTRSRRHD